MMIVGVALAAQEKKAYTPVQVEAYFRTKAKLGWTAYDTRLVANMKGYKVVPKFKVTRYGSDPSVRRKATGFFRTEKVNGRWWMVDPEGYRHLNMVVVHIGAGNGETNKEAFAAKFGTQEKWIDSAAELLFSNGFSGSGAWSKEDLIIEYNKTAARPLTRTPILGLMAGYGRSKNPGGVGKPVFPNKCIPVFDPGFETFCNEQAKYIAKWKDDPSVVGYFSDNELSFGKHMLEGYLKLEDPADPGRKAAEEWMKGKGITVEQITDAHRDEFVGVVAERYYSVVSNAIRANDPNHMYIGSRLYGAQKVIRELFEAAGRYCDVVSVNYYGEWTPVEKSMRDWGEWSGKPFAVTEFYTKGQDSGLGNKSGAGATVHTQLDRGYGYQNFCLGLLESGNCVGWHWFRYQDNDPTYKKADPSNIDGNKGIVDNSYNPYTDLLKLMRELNVNAYRIADYFDKK